MKQKKLAVFLCIMTLILLSLPLTKISIAASSISRIYIYDPQTKTNVSSANISETFTIKVNVENVIELYAWQFWLKWGSNLLDLVRVSEGPFLNSSGAYESYFVPKVMASDTIFVMDALKGAPRSATANGNGTLAEVTFRVKAEGVCALHLMEEPPLEISKLINYDQKLISHTYEDGYFAHPVPRVSVGEVVDSSLVADKNVSISITVANVTNLYRWSLRLKWSPALLDALTVAEGSFLKGNGTTIFGTPEIDQASGSLYINCTLTDEPLGGVNGSGTLAAITFRVKTRGFTSLELYVTKLYKRMLGGSMEFIPHIPSNGYFSNTVRDVAITSVEASKYSVKRGESVNVTVIAKNKGETTEDFHVTVYYDSNSIGTSSVSSLSSGGLKALTFTWDTWSASPGEYTIKAEASILAGEAETDDNTLVCPTKVTVIGEQSGNPIILWIGVVAAIMVIGVASVFFYRRTKR